MSRIGNKPITVPNGVDIKIENNHITVKGPKGTLERTIEPEISVKLEDNVLTVSRDSDERRSKSLHGLTRTLINNMIMGVQQEFTRELQINGVGYRVQKQGNNLNLSLGYSHPVIYEAPEGITFDVPNANTIIVKGINKELVGQTAADIRTKRPPEVYRGKGIKYAEEVIRRKVGKTGK
jgi:large subunit ribosomal protein L6